MSPDLLLASLATQAHIWLTEPSDIDSAAARTACLDLLAPEELEQYERFRVERARDLYLAARALARSALSLYVPIEPKGWLFRFNEHGRPEIDGPAGIPPLRFNLSHTDGLVACLVTLELDAGVDVEETRRRIDLLGVAEHSFSAVEVAEVRARDGDERRRRFFSYWTLKEAYIKARGMGLALPLRRFSYTFPEEGEVEITFDPRLGDRERDWQFHLFRSSASHMLASAIRRGDEPDRDLVIRRSSPLATDVRELELHALASSRSRVQAA